MSLDPKIKEAIQIAVSEAGQNDTLARYLNAWMNAIVSGNEDVNDKQSAGRHLKLLFDATEVDVDIED